MSNDNVSTSATEQAKGHYDTAEVKWMIRRMEIVFVFCVGVFITSLFGAMWLVHVLPASDSPAFVGTLVGLVCMAMICGVTGVAMIIYPGEKMKYEHLLSKSKERTPLKYTDPRVHDALSADN